MSPAAECHHVTSYRCHSSLLHRRGSWCCPRDPASCHFRARRGSVRAPGVTLSPSPHPDLSSETRGQMWHLGSDVCHLGSPPDLTSQICHLSWPGRGHTRCHIRAEVTRADQQTRDTLSCFCADADRRNYNKTEPETDDGSAICCHVQAADISLLYSYQ